MSQIQQKEDENDRDWISLALGIHEDWRLRRRARAIQKHQRRAAKDAASRAGAATPSGASFVGVESSLANKAQIGLKRTLQKTRELATRVINPAAVKKAMAIAALFIPLYLAQAGALQMAGCIVNGMKEWVSVPASAGQVLNDGEAFSQNRMGLMEKSSFFAKKAIDPAGCLASGRCQEVALGWRKWWDWRLTGQPPSELARLGWAHAPWRANFQNYVVVSFAQLVSLLITIVFAAQAVKVGNDEKKQGEWHPLAKALAILGNALEFATLTVVAVAFIGLLAAGMDYLIEKDNADMASPSRDSMQAVIEGRIRAEQADWVKAGDPRSWVWNSPEEIALAKACVNQGFCVTENIEKDASIVASQAVKRNREIARARVNAEPRIDFIRLSLIAAIFLIALEGAWVLRLEVGDDTGRWANRLARWTAQGRPRMERAQMLAQIRQAKKSSGKNAEASRLARQEEPDPAGRRSTRL